MTCWMRGRPRGLASLASKLIAASCSARSLVSLVVFPLLYAECKMRQRECVHVSCEQRGKDNDEATG